MCLRWPAPTGDDPLAGALPDVPVRIANGDLDANTPLSSARALARSFPRATMLTVPNVGHAPETDPSGCALRIYRRFLRTHAAGSTACLRKIPPPGG